MDYSNRAGSKKGSGGIASTSIANVRRKQQVEELLMEGVQVPYTFEDKTADPNGDNDKLRMNPYVFRSNTGKLVCKLCNTMHMSWSSVERHLEGKKHSMALMRRGGIEEQQSQDHEESDTQKEIAQLVEKRKNQIEITAGQPSCKIQEIQDFNSQSGFAFEIDYTKCDSSEPVEIIYPPSMRIVTGAELTDDDDNDSVYLVIACEPFENIAIKLPSKSNVVVDEKAPNIRDAFDDLNAKYSRWVPESRRFYGQLFYDTVDN